ncbi:MAG: hypothetical protein K6B40_06480 [Firmicutes bacterium]|nr:hypothetical protein [Bacillota bacterium]
MDYTAEHHFVQAFIRKSRRERLLYELTAPKKRYDGISRFCHQAKELLDPAKIIMEGEDMDRRPEFARFVRQHEEVCLLLSPDSFLDGQYLPLAEAVNRAILCPDAVLILGGAFAVVFGEPMKGGRGKFLLSED